MVTVSTIDEVLALIGELGRCQLMVLAIVCALMIPATFQYLITYFIAHSPPWRCKDNSTLCLLKETIAASSHENYTYRCDVPREEWEYVEDATYSIVTQVRQYTHVIIKKSRCIYNYHRYSKVRVCRYWMCSVFAWVCTCNVIL